MILNPDDVKKHLQFRAPYTPAELNETREQFLQFNGRLFGLEIIDQPLTVPASIIVKPGAFITQNRVIVELLTEQTINKATLAAPFALVGRTDNEIATSNTELLFVEDQLIKSTDAILAEFDELGLIKEEKGFALGNAKREVRGGLVDRKVISSAASQTVFDTRGLCYSTLNGSDLLVFRNGRKLSFNLFGTNPSAGWIQSVGGITYVGTDTIAFDEKWEFILDRSIKTQERFTGDNSTTKFTLTTATYKTDLGQTLVFVDGLYQVLEVDYQETDSSSITFFTAPATNVSIEIVITDGTIVFETFAGLVTGEINLDLSKRMDRGGHAALVFKNGLKLLRIDDYIDKGCERIELVTPLIYEDEFAVYELQTTLRSVLNREFRELIDVSTGNAEAVTDPTSARTQVASKTNVFKTAGEITAEINAAIAGLGDIQPFDFRSAAASSFFDFTDVTITNEVNSTDGEVYAVVTGNDNLQSAKVGYPFKMLTNTVKEIKIPLKFSDSGGSNDATVKLLDSDGTQLAIKVAGAPTTRTETVLTNSGGSPEITTQPTDRFVVVVEITIDNLDEARTGGVLVSFA